MDVAFSSLDSVAHPDSAGMLPVGRLESVRKYPTRVAISDYTLIRSEGSNSRRIFDTSRMIRERSRKVRFR